MFKHYQDMALFAELMNAGSFTKVAEQLGIPKSRVSQRINHLEEFLGIRLLNRSTRRVSLTSAGERYLTHCQELAEVGTRADECVRQIKAQPSGQLRIVAPPGLMVSLLSQWNDAFLKIHPEINLEVLTADSFHKSIEGAFDLAFRIGKPMEQSYVGRFLGEFNRLLVASPTYLERNPVYHPQDLRNISVHTHKTWKKLALTRDDEAIEQSLTSLQNTDNLLYLLQCALLGSGIALLPEYLALPYIMNGQLAVILPEWEVEKIDLWMVYPSSKNNSLNVKTYTHFITQAAASHKC